MASSKKIPKDPNAPKRPVRPFIYFSKEMVGVIRDELRTDPEISSNLTSAVSKECGRRWHALSEEEKEKYEMMYKKDFARYKEEMLSYTPSEEYKEKVKLAKRKIKHDRTVNNLDSKVAARVPHMVRAYFDYLISTWSKIAASNPHLSPEQVQEEVWRRWSKGENGDYRDKNQNLVENKKSRAKKRKRSNSGPTLKQPKQAFQCFLEQVKGEVWKQVPNLPYTDLVHHVSAKWKVMTQEEKDYFSNQESKEREKYQDLTKNPKFENDAGSNHVDRDAPTNSGALFLKRCTKLEIDSSKSSNGDLEIHFPEEKGLHAVISKDYDRNSRTEIADGAKQTSSSSSSSSSEDSSDDDSDDTESDE